MPLPPASKKKKVVFWAMISSMVLGYMPWYNFSALLGYIATEFSLDSGDTGTVLSAFQIGYVVVVGVTGWLADKISLKRIIFWATLLTGISAMAFVWLARDLGSILVLRLITGLSAGAIYVPGMTLLSRWFPPHERGNALGAYTGAVVAAYAGGYVLASWIASFVDWRAGILWTSIPAIFAALIIWFFVEDRDIPLDPSKNPDSAPNPVRAQSRGLAPKGGYAGPAIITAGYVGHMWELYAFWGWVGPFLVATALASGMNQSEAVSWGGAFAAGIILLGAPASWLWGKVADNIGRTKSIAMASLFSVLAEFFLGYLFGHSLGIILVLAGWIGFWVVADSAIFKAGLTEMVTARYHGIFLGIQSLIGFGATIISPFVFGQILEIYNGDVSPTQATIWGPGFLILGLGGLLAPAASLWLRKHRQARLMANGKK
jgi:MFS family permease